MTRVDEVTEVIHGVAVADPYRWLESGDDPETIRWTAGQNEFTRGYLDDAPERAAVRSRLEQLLGIGVLGTPMPARGRYFYVRREGQVNQPILYWRDGLHGDDRVVLDPNLLSADGTVALDWYYPSIDGQLLAYGLSEAGSEDSVLHLLHVESGALLRDRIPKTRACDLAWLPDSSGFYYTRYPAAGEVPAGEESYHRAVWFHRLGTDPSIDTLTWRPREKEHWPGVGLSDDGRWLLVSVARTFDQVDLYVRNLETGSDFTTVAEGLEAIVEGQVVRGVLYIRTNLHASTFGLYAADPGNPGREHWRELVAPRGDAVLSSVGVTARHLVLDFLSHAVARLEVASLDGQDRREVPLPALGSLFGLGYEPDGQELLFGFSSWTVPPSVYRVDLADMSVALWRRVEADVDPAAFDVRQVRYASRDGTMVSMFVASSRARDHGNPGPCFLTGYGGFGISMTPAFSRSMLLWLEAGGVMAVPNLRGGGEYGETWHQAGMMAQKQNTFDDFIAAAEWLIAERITTPAQLAIQGGSNGGLLMGAVLTQRPDLFRAVVIQVPLLDMLRYHQFLIARLWIPEYGSAEDPAQFGWLHAYSPYHQVRDGVAYPAVMLATAESDTRVDPLHARKMTARLQAATASGHPVLLRLESRAGHGAGKPLAKLLDELTDTWTFIWHELGLAAPGR